MQLPKKRSLEKMFENNFDRCFCPANFIFGIYYKTHTKEKDRQGLFLFHFLTEFSDVTDSNWFGFRVIQPS